MHILTVSGGLLGTNCYLAWQEGQDCCVAIDPGFEDAEILQQIRAQGKKLEAILLTHGHFDHVGGVKLLQEETGCRVYLHEKDLQLPAYLTHGEISATDYYGDSLHLAGLDISVLHTPGHTPGSVCLLCENVIFSGDTLFASTCGRTDLPGGSYPEICKSLKRLADLPGDYQVLPGHGETTTLDAERQGNPYMQGA